MLGSTSLKSKTFEKMFLFVFENSCDGCFLDVLHLKNLLVFHCLSNDLFPNLVHWESFQVTNNDASVLCPRKTDIDSPHITNKPNRFLSVVVELFSIKPRSDRTQNNNILLSSLERINRFDFQCFCIYRSLNAIHLLAVRRHNTDVFTVFLNELRQFLNEFSLVDIHIWLIFTLFVAWLQVEHHESVW